MMKKVDLAIMRQCCENIHHLRKIMHCPHEWEKYAFGYKCEKCGEYTGTNDTLNEMIKNERIRSRS